MKNEKKKIKVLLGPSSFGEFDADPLNYLKETGYEIILNPYKRKLTKRELFELLKDDVLGIIAGLEPLDREVLEKTKLKVISRCGSGLSNVDQKTAKELEIKVFSTPDGPTLAVAELTIGIILSLLRFITRMNQDLHEGKWNKRTGFQLKDKNVVIIGFGHIGQKVASLLKPFKAHIIVVDPYLKKMNFKNVELLPLNTALKKADIVTIHCSGEEEVLGEKQFCLMKKGSLVLNAARGSVINEDALIKALDAGRVSGAWLDTFCKEPYDGCLRSYPQVILTPHVGSYTVEGRKKMEMDAVSSLVKAFNELKNNERTKLKRNP